MKISEIITNPPKDEYIDQYRYHFSDCQEIATIKNLFLKRCKTPDEIEYGLIDQNENIIGYFSLEHYDNDIWSVNLVQLAQAYKGMGYGTFFYDYAIMNDKLKILSDATNTEGQFGSRALWERLRNNKRYDIVGYDTDTNAIIPNATPEMIYDNQPNTRWLAIPPSETINESIQRIQSYMKKRYVVWYGPGTTSETYFNY